MAARDPWQGQALVVGTAALVGAGCGAGSALVYVARHVDALAARVGRLEREVEAGKGPAAAAGPGADPAALGPEGTEPPERPRTLQQEKSEQPPPSPPAP